MGTPHLVGPAGRAPLALATHRLAQRTTPSAVSVLALGAHTCRARSFFPLGSARGMGMPDEVGEASWALPTLWGPPGAPLALATHRLAQRTTPSAVSVLTPACERGVQKPSRSPLTFEADNAVWSVHLVWGCTVSRMQNRASLPIYFGVQVEISAKFGHVTRISGVKNRAIRMPCVHIRAVHGTVLVLGDRPYRGGDL
jgi:hypothetical protein